MEHIFVLALVATILFCICKVVEQKYLENEMKPLKYIIRDAFMVFFATFGAGYGVFYARGSISDFFNVITDTKVLSVENTQIFTDAPGF